jgi:hypothetical protein
MWFKGRDKDTGSRGEPLPLRNEGPPDSYRPSGLCPRCGKQSSFEAIGSMGVTFDSTVAVNRDLSRERLTSDRVTVLVCRHCEQGVVVIEEEWCGEAPRRQNTGGGTISHRGIHWWPLPSAQVSDDVPVAIAEAFKEAARALAADCPRAAAVMARRTLEAIADEKGQTTGTLAQRLDGLAKSGLLHPSLTEWTKEVRLVGNSGAHFDPLSPVERHDADELVTFIREVLKYLYELPANLARRRASKP